MTKFEHRQRILPPARLTSTELRAIQDALGADFKDATEWTFWSGHTEISEKSLDVLLDELKDIKGLSDFEMSADIPDARVYISAGADGCLLEYASSHALEGQIATKARAIEGIFRDNKRRTAYIPRPLVSLPGIKRLALSPAIKVGQARMDIHIEWNQVATKLIADWLSYVGTAAVSFALG